MSERSQNQPPSPPTSPMAPVACPLCGAENPVSAAKCWICQQTLTVPVASEGPFGSAISRPEFVDSTARILPNTLFALAAAALVIMGYGVYSVYSGWLAYYVFLFGLPLLAMAGILRYALLSSDKNVRQAGAILTPIYVTLFAVLGSLGIVFLTLAAVVILVISIFVAFGEMCFNMSNNGN